MFDKIEININSKVSNVQALSHYVKHARPEETSELVNVQDSTQVKYARDKKDRRISILKSYGKLIRTNIT